MISKMCGGEYHIRCKLYTQTPELQMFNPVLIFPIILPGQYVLQLLLPVVHVAQIQFQICPVLRYLRVGFCPPPPRPPPRPPGGGADGAKKPRNEWHHAHSWCRNLCTLIEKICENLNFNEYMWRGRSESHTSLKCQQYRTFTPPHQEIFIEFSIFADFFFLTVFVRREQRRWGYAGLPN